MVDLLHGYIGLAEYWEAMPHSQVLRITSVTGQADVVFEENDWIDHVTTSPNLPHTLIYRHEGTLISKIYPTLSCFGC